MLRVDELCYNYGESRFRYALSVTRGEILSVIGPSGSGKSTLLLMIGGFLAPSSGTLTLDDRDLLPLSPGLRPITTIFQDHNLFPHLSVFQNIAIGLNPGLKLTDEQHALIDDALARSYLTEYRSRRPDQLSGGQRQRVSLARALARKRPLLLLDEAFTALGPSLRNELLELTRSIVQNESMMALMVSHHPEDSFVVSNRIAFVDEGQVSSIFSPADLRSKALDKAVLDYLA